MSLISPVNENELEQYTIYSIIDRTIEEGVATFLESVQGKEIIKGCDLEKQKDILKRIIYEVDKDSDATLRNLGITIDRIMDSEKIGNYNVQEIKDGIIKILISSDENCDINILLKNFESNKTKAFIAFLLNVKIEKYLQDYYWFFIGNLLDRSTFNENDNRIFILKIVNRIVKRVIGNRKITRENYKKLINFVNSKMHERIDDLKQYSFAMKTPYERLLIKIIEKIMMYHFLMKYEEMKATMDNSMRKSGFNQETIIDALLKKYESSEIFDILRIRDKEISNRRNTFVNEIREPLYKRMLRRYIEKVIDNHKFWFIEYMKDKKLTEEQMIDYARNMGYKSIPKEWIDIFNLKSENGVILTL